MTPEAVRRQYLDAMGIASWASRYALPNALPTQACEWDDTPTKTPPRDQLHALLDDAATPRSDAVRPAALPSDVKALLSNGSATPLMPEADPPPVPNPVPAAPVKSLEFSFTCVCLDGRWLNICEGTMLPVEQRLLSNILRAAGLIRGELPALTHFKWPPIATAFAPDEPLEEAQEGVAAFIDGAASRQGWQLEKVLWWGAAEAADSVLGRVISLDNQQSNTLLLPVWQGPSLASLASSASLKRALWPHLVELAAQWKR